MNALFLVLYKIEKLDDILYALKSNNINGGTIIDSQGMLNKLNQSNNVLFDSIRIFLDEPRDLSKVLFFILDNDDLNIARKVINEAIGGIKNPNTGIMFNVKLDFVDGLKAK